MSLLRPGTTLHDEIDLVTSAVHVTPFSKHVLVYYVPGNPGYIEYYRNFLGDLTRMLNQKKESAGQSHQTQYHVHGESLAGFQFQGKGQRQPHSLDEIKGHLIDSIDRKAAEVIKTYDLKQEALPVILIGHSIGTWLILEAVESSRCTSPSFKYAKIEAGILLFPTVIDLAKSPNGLRFGWALQYRQAALLLSLIARMLFFFMPLFLVTALLQVLLQMPYHSALVTASFLKKDGAVRQALYMAHGELTQVREDVWSDTLWGKQASSLSAKEAKALAKDTVGSSSKLFFYWGAHDHWVANATRDAVIARRAQTAATGDERKPVMYIDSHGLPHAFALHDRGARIVADKVADWIEKL